MRKLTCLRCGGQMAYVKREKLQLGQTGWLLGDWPNLLAGALPVDIYCCRECGKIEFYAAEQEPETVDAMPQVACPHCGHKHDLDDAKCPFCGTRLQEIE